MKNDIAIIGISVKYPEIDTKDDFWKFLTYGGSTIKDCPKERELYSKRFHNEIKDSNYFFTKAGYFDDIFSFDNSLFHISPKDALSMDPYQRIFLENSFHALEDAGYSFDSKNGQSIGVFVGMPTEYSNHSYQDIIKIANPEIYKESFSGNLPAMLPARISYFLNLTGPTMLIDTSCSSSLSAVHVASKAVLSGDCEMALIGGINLFIDPAANEVVNDLGIISSDFKIKAFDDNNNGVVNGEGCGIILIKRLDSAIESKDKIYAIIKGSYVNQDGASLGITAPNLKAQKDVIRQAWENSGLHISDATFIEAHGTSTKIGDPTEIGAIKAAFENDKKQSCGIGSIKTNLGHTIGAAGITSLIKATLCLNKKCLVPSINFEYPNHNINFLESPLYVIQTVQKVNQNSKLSCGINSFGISGTNVHVVLEEHINLNAPNTSFVISENYYPIIISAENENSLRINIESTFEFLKQNPEISILDISYSSIFRKRLCRKFILFIVNDISDLCSKMEKYIAENNYSENIILYSDDINEDINMFVKEIRDCRDQDLFKDVVKKYFDFELAKFISLPLYGFDRRKYRIEFEKEKYKVFIPKWVKITEKDSTADTSLSVMIIDLDQNRKYLRKVHSNTKLNKLLDNAKTIYDVECQNNVSSIIIKLDLMQIEIFSETFGNRIKNIYHQLFKILKAYITVENKLDIYITLITDKNGTDSMDPYASSIFGMFQSIQWENLNISVKCFSFDLDSFVSTNLNDLISLSKYKIVKVQNNIPYMEMLYSDMIEIPLNLDEKSDRLLIIGGTGRIGTKLYSLLKASFDEINCTSSKNIQEFIKCNILDKGDIKKLLEDYDDTKKTHIIYLPVNDSNDLINDLTFESFMNAQEVKIGGILNLVEEVSKYKNFEIIAFSSVMSYLGSKNNTSYICSNMFIDNLVTYSKSKKVSLRIINWPEWKNIGLIENLQFEDKKSFFNKIEPEDAANIIKAMTNTSLLHIIPAEINFKSELLHIYEKFPIHFNEITNSRFEKNKPIINENINLKDKKSIFIEVLKEALGYDEINLNDNFIEIGGDSISAFKISAMLDDYKLNLSANDILSIQNLDKLSKMIVEEG